MENAARTAAYHALMAERTDDVSRRLAAIFSGDESQRFVWELGCGHGHFLNAYAAAHPEKVCVGIDIVGERIERALRKRDRAGLQNLHFIHAEARLFLGVLPRHVSIEQLFILFPDPWPKKRHHKHRIIQPSFLEAVAARCAPSARVHFRTDYQPYFEDARAVFVEHPRWEIADEPWPFEQETVFQARAESYYSLTARPVRA